MGVDKPELLPKHIVWSHWMTFLVHAPANSSTITVFFSKQKNLTSLQIQYFTQESKVDIITGCEIHFCVKYNWHDQNKTAFASV